MASGRNRHLTEPHTGSSAGTVERRNLRGPPERQDARLMEKVPYPILSSPMR